MTYELRMARSKLANAVRSGDPTRIRVARAGFHAVKLRLAISEHAEHMTWPDRQDLASVLLLMGDVNDKDGVL